MRVSVSDKLGYPLDPTPDYHLTIPPAQRRWVDSQGAPVALFFHATSKDDKKWPVSHWIEVGRELTARGFHVALPWGSDAERRAANEIAAGLPVATVLPRLSVTEVAQVIEQSSLVVGTDTGFVHLAHALLKRTVMIFTATSAAHLGIRAPYRSLSVGDDRRDRLRAVHAAGGGFSSRRAASGARRRARHARDFSSGGGLRGCLSGSAARFCFGYVSRKSSRKSGGNSGCLLCSCRTKRKRRDARDAVGGRPGDAPRSTRAKATRAERKVCRAKRLQLQRQTVQHTGSSISRRN
jgi:hypothetical protein